MASIGAHELEVHRGHGRDEADVGLGDGGQLGDLAVTAHPHLEHERLGPGGRLEHRHGQPDLGVEVLAVGHRAQALAEHRGEDVLGRGLPHRARDPDHGAAQRAAPRGGQALQGRERVVGRDHGSGRCVEPVGVLGRHQHPPRAAVQRLRREAPAVDVLADQPHEEVAGPDRARVDHSARGTAGLRSRRDEPPAGGLRHLLRRPRAHAGPRGRRPRRRRAPCGRPRTPDSARGPCRRRRPRRPRRPVRWRARWPPGDRSRAR